MPKIKVPVDSDENPLPGYGCLFAIFLCGRGKGNSVLLRRTLISSEILNFLITSKPNYVPKPPTPPPPNTITVEFRAWAYKSWGTHSDHSILPLPPSLQVISFLPAKSVHFITTAPQVLACSSISSKVSSPKSQPNGSG